MAAVAKQVSLPLLCVCAQAQPGAGSSNAAVITDLAIAEVVAAFAGIAGEANGAQLQKLLSNIQQQQAAATRAADASGQQPQQQPQDASAVDLEVDLLSEGNKDVRKVRKGASNSQMCRVLRIIPPFCYLPFLVMGCM
jgi:ABC-type transport system involved in cytochrome bd biosynthesis fused ATPase/permease subunit